MPKGKTVRTDRARSTFLEALRTSCNVSASCREAGIGRSAAYAWKREDESFSEDWDEVHQEAIDNLEGVAYARAMAGESDRMLEILLKAHRSEKFVEKRLIGSDPDNPLPDGFNVNLVGKNA